MASVTLKDIPDELMDRLRRQAETDHRSLNKEAVFLLESALTQHGADSDAHGPPPGEQAATWRQLAGRWRSDYPIDQEIAAIYKARTTGRDVDL